MIVSNILGVIFFGGAAQTGGVGVSAAVVPEPTRPILGTVSGPAPILVPVPGQEHVDYLNSTYLVLNFILSLRAIESPRVERAALNPPTIRTYPSPSPTCFEIELEIKKAIHCICMNEKR